MALNSHRKFPFFLYHATVFMINAIENFVNTKSIRFRAIEMVQFLKSKMQSKV